MDGDIDYVMEHVTAKDVKSKEKRKSAPPTRKSMIRTSVDKAVYRLSTAAKEPEDEWPEEQLRDVWGAPKTVRKKRKRKR